MAQVSSCQSIFSTPAASTRRKVLSPPLLLSSHVPLAPHGLCLLLTPRSTVTERINNELLPAFSSLRSCFFFLADLQPAKKALRLRPGYLATTVFSASERQVALEIKPQAEAYQTYEIDVTDLTKFC